MLQQNISLGFLFWFTLVVVVFAFPFETLHHISPSLHTRDVFVDYEHLGLQSVNLYKRILDRPAFAYVPPTQQPALVNFRRAPPKAAPKAAPKDTKQSSKSVPTVTDIEKQLHFGKNQALFWSGDRNQAADYAKKNGLRTMDMAISGETPWNTKWLQDPKIKDEYWDRASTAMVNVVSGTVYVMLRGGKSDPIAHLGTVWTRKEWPHI